jgi:regulatory protein YycH of two-component signal transduction system YycFG
MWERIKTLLLVSLVGLSLFLTFSLWQNKPSFEPMNPPDYEKPLQIGKTAEWVELVKPIEVVFHYEGNRHTKATPDMPQFTIMADVLKKWQFYNPQKIRLSAEEVKKILEDYNGLEYIYPDGVPIHVISQVLDLPEELMTELQEINRIWIYEEKEDNPELNVLFISNIERKVLKGKLLQKDQGGGIFSFSNLIQIGSQLSEQMPVFQEGDIFYILYLPNGETYVNQLTYEVSTIDIYEMAKALFLDMSVMREVPERDGSWIFTDGAKSLQSSETNHDMRYYVPTHEGIREREDSLEIQQILEFMNRHYGWTGEYRFDQWEQGGESDIISFREAIRGFSVYGNDQERKLGEITLHYNEVQVNEYSRSLIRFERIKRMIRTRILSGEELLAILNEKEVPLNRIRQIHLGYQSIGPVSQSEMKLIPVYVVYKKWERDPLIINARAAGGEG